MTISIRPPATIEEYNAIEWLQTKIWGTGIGITPGIFLFVIAKEGGVILLALDDDKPIGFAYGFLGLTEDNQIKLVSHQTGVLPTYRDSGLGYKLKLAQREAVLAKNVDLITWTFDPLQGRNARFNLRKLGAVCNTYLPNLYGDMPDALNQGLPSDRFRVDWWITTERVTQKILGQVVEPNLLAKYPVLNAATKLEHDLSVPADTFDVPTGNLCLVEIPANLTILKKEAPNLALKWRLQTREIFEVAFKTGYTTVDLLRQEGRNYYLLQKNWQQEGMKDESEG